MAGFSPTATATTGSSSPQNYTFALSALTTLFFMWGFLTCLNDILIPHLKEVFDLNYTQGMLIQFCFFGAYFLVSLPAGLLVKKVGYKTGAVIGLVVAAAGCLLFYPAAALREYGVFLSALFVLAAGITILQVSANPYVAILGKPATASSRLTLTQAFNSFGTTIAPMIGGALILGAVTVDSNLTGDALLQAKAQAVQIPYVALASALLLLAAIFAFLKLPIIVDEALPASTQDSGSAWQYTHLVLGAVGIFVYVGGEVAIGSLLVNFMGLPEIAGLAEKDAANYVSYYWGGAMIGRFIGSAVMQSIPAGKVLAFNAVAAVVLILVAVFASGSVAMWAILAVGLCNSVMFPTIFSLAVTGLGRHTSQGSSILCMAIVGGALIPLAQGALADTLGLQLSFLLPILCYLYIVFYGLKGHKNTLQPQ
ncbi:MAG: sugar MFS transporter [Moraxellaceae bacterium]|jgi:MFS transporter, FHS family, L-fucose permease|nr:MAG: sugar MFS transporter [Moraxellaceae bacterium]